MEWKDCYNDNTTQGNPRVQNVTDIFNRTVTNNFKISVETQKTLNSQNNLKKEQQIWRWHTPWFQTILQSYSHQKQYGTSAKTDT